MDEKSVADMWDSISDLHNDWESISGEERYEYVRKEARKNDMIEPYGMIGSVGNPFLFKRYGR